LGLLKQPLWTPSQQRVKEANITAFIGFVNKRYGLQLKSYQQLYKWSVDEIPNFWSAVWDFVGIKSSQSYTRVVDDLSKFPGAKWFPDAKLNFAENLMKRNDDHLAFIFRSETQRTASITYHELHRKVSNLAKWLRTMGLRSGDRVCAYIPNLIETVIAMLASTSIGATWASCGAELGSEAVVDRLGQIEPSFMFTSDGYFYGNKVFNILPNVQQVVKEVPSLKGVIVVPYVSRNPAIENMPGFTLYDEIVSSTEETQLEFAQLPFDHPVYIMFSSGTTGKPKCMVQGVGVLLNQLTDLVLDADLKENDRITYITSASWMMWNWLVSSLAVGATIILYDGNPNYPDWTAMWKLIQDERISIFGCSATYINHLKTINATPGKTCDLSSLREISQTGSPLSSEGFEWIYREIKNELHFNSISGGTDINATFASGNPTLSVYAGEISGPTLGMKINAYDENGKTVFDQEGELVCEAPAPSMPLYFWKDETNERYLAAYFNFYGPLGRNVWRHGDFIVVHSDTHGITFLGRSDSVLKPSGVRIGTAEIYNVVDKFPEIADSLVVGQNWKGDQRIILFVKLNSGYTLTEDLKSQIRQTLRSNASPRHVPAVILETPGIPYTFNMKKVESAVRNILDGKPVPNRDAIANPESLQFFERIVPELQK
jgi:acetoacetyl-CoA synthetase